MKKLLIFVTSLFSANASSQMEFDLDKVLKMERRDMIIMEIDTYLNKKCEYGEKVDRLNESQKVLLIVENLEREINNGGFHQFYWNSSGEYANETIDALIKIGANETAEIVKKANSEFKNEIVPKDRAERHNELELIEEKAKENWNKCDSEFYEYQDNLIELLIAFVIKNKPDFEK
ncbi:DMP19 family protein [Tenacibaculum sp. SZ-18]|uniref:DMP19 family protein n=1 Tax=Tenacibaculum sp. SZ-18 TaxID=754423 RepID=UPI0012FE357C|nr:DMP19 family protein [Tenacibaculum sp. SZ-18]